MSDTNDPSLEERIEHLEQLVEKLQYTIERMQDRLTAPMSRREGPRPERAPSRSSTPPNGSRSAQVRTRSAEAPASTLPAGSASVPPEPASPPQSSRPMYSLDSDAWLNRIGIGLLFLGVGLALKYTFDQIWFTPLLRVMSGSFVGLLLLAFGLHFHRRRPRFGQVLLAGGIGTFYLTAYAAYQLYNLVPYGVAFAGMLTITVLSFLLSARRDDTFIAILATLGGLVTPFIMHADKGHLTVLVVYTSLILIGAGAMYWFRGWRSLLFSSAIGSWLVILFCYFNFAFGLETISSERWMLQAGTLVSCLLFWLMPIVRGYLRAIKPHKWPAPPPVKAVGYFFNHPALPLSVTTPIFTLIMSVLIWDFSENLWGWVILLASSIFGFLYLAIRLKDRKDLNHLAQMQGLTAAIFLTGGIYLLYDSHYLLVALIIEAALIRVVARTMDDRMFALASHTIVFALFAWIGNRLITMQAMQPYLFNTPALCELAVLAVSAVLAASIRTRWMAASYFSLTHILLIGWLYRQLEGMDDGQALITTAWGAYAVVLFILAIRTNWRILRITSLSTLALVVIKLFLVDLEEVEPLIRVLLFLGFGIVFMMLSYIIPSLFSRPASPPAAVTENPPDATPEKALQE